MVKDYFCDLYKANYLIAIGEKPLVFTEIIKNRFDIDIDLSNSDGYCAELTSEDGYYQTIIWVRYKKNIAELAHEVAHACMNLFDTRGLKYSSDNSEQFTYYLEKMMRVCLAN